MYMGHKIKLSNMKISYLRKPRYHYQQWQHIVAVGFIIKIPKEVNDVIINESSGL